MSTVDIDSILSEYKIHHKDIDSCFNDAVAVTYIKNTLKAELLAKLPKQGKISTDEKWNTAHNNTIREITKLIEEL